jgi:hydrogenase expression/formation protein HypC
MCLAIPGHLTDITEPGTLAAIGCVAYGEIRKQVSLALVPEARVGDWVLVHAGIAMKVIHADDAARVFAVLAGTDPALAEAPGSATASATTPSHRRAKRRPRRAGSGQ